MKITKDEFIEGCVIGLFSVVIAIALVELLSVFIFVTKSLIEEL